ncbi:4-carboxymuconolactone decarboxylase [Pseudoroseomonas deserti]|uniref:4-carboxymuconolactone decarboxylase n=1 Tax=Teichococcus deserti TaxID=1817963 RepID=A0A1V2H7T7_9PROT|nr:carboxymuconolactone decarboxylase family protein [Pseudoroseomonas deserti]ONG58907.1 4-carboxymuconolactone decarboxylase [Pseudoroseomonas deserti]
MARLSLPAEDARTEAQRLAVAEVTAGRRGRVPAPMIAWLQSPELARRGQHLGEMLRYETTLEPSLSELAILVTARHWTAHHEWVAHKREGLKAGMDPAVIAAIAARREPVFRDDRERAVFAVSKSLLETRGVPDALYAQAIAVLGERGLVELVGILGYYALVSMTLNTFELGLPENVAPELAETP